jgi:O-acetyl-ADP-ribose deacetylase (regulator of RNase III)
MMVLLFQEKNYWNSKDYLKDGYPNSILYKIVKMKYIDGDLIKLAQEGKFDVIGHGCNCFLSMGAGIAKSIRQNFPEAYTADWTTRRGDKNKLGTFTMVDYGDLIVLNLYTQFKYTSIDVDVDYDAVRNCMKLIKKRFSGKRIGLPMIGCGLAGGDWNIVSKIIEEELDNEDITIVKFKK